jgi:hypothetical protein
MGATAPEATAPDATRRLMSMNASPRVMPVNRPDALSQAWPYRSRARTDARMNASPHLMPVNRPDALSRAWPAPADRGPQQVSG